MKTILVIAALMIFSVAPAAFAQSKPVSTGSEDNVTRNDDMPRQHNYGWIGLIGLAGLAGLRRQKSEDVRRRRQRQNDLNSWLDGSSTTRLSEA